MTTRDRTPEPPYCWQSKEALRKLREHLDGDTLLPFALLTYVALTVNASDKMCESFTSLQTHIATLAGNISTRTIRRVLPILREIGLVEYQTPKLRGPITFTLLSMSPESVADRTDSPNVRTGSFSGIQSANRSNLEETEKKDSSPVSPKRPSRQPSNRIQLVDDDHISELKTIYTARSVDIAAAACRAWLLTPKGTGKAFSKLRLQTFLRNAEPIGAAPAAQQSTRLDIVHHKNPPRVSTS